MVAFALGAPATGAMAVLWIPLRAGHSNGAVALAMMPATTAVGAARSRPAVLGATVCAAVSFTYFDTQPFDRFTIAKQPDVATAVSLVVVGLLTGEVALRMARARRAEESTSGYLWRVRDAAARLAQGEELAVFIGAVAAELAAVVGGEGCEFSAEPLPAAMAVVDRSGRLDPPAAPGATAVALPVWALGEDL